MHVAMYKGKLGNGHLMAVKISNSSKGNDKKFFIEVISICCTYYINFMSLLGFYLKIFIKIIYMKSWSVVSRPEPNIRIGYVMAAHSLEQALKNMQGQNKYYNLNIHNN